MKVHLLNEDYMCVPKKKDFTEYLKEKISENQRF